MTRDAQQAADAAMVEIRKRCWIHYECGNLFVNPKWLHTFLANVFDEWLTKIGGEQADLSAGDADARHVISSDAHPVVRPLRGGDPQPATPIDTEALAKKIVNSFRDSITIRSGVFGKAQFEYSDLTVPAVKRILDEALAQQHGTTPRCGVCGRQMSLHATWKTWDCAWCRGAMDHPQDAPLDAPRCHVCDKPYSDHGLDITLPDDQWSAIVGDRDMILCGSCIAYCAAMLPGAVAIRAHIEFAATGSQPVEVCEWDYDGWYWNSGCGRMWELDAEGTTPKENDMSYCPFCGKPIREVPFKEVSDEQ